MRAAQFALCGALLIVSSRAVAVAPRSWEYLGPGQWQEVSAAPATTQPAADPTLDRAQQMLEANQHQRARKLLVRWLKANKTSPLRERALYLMADACFRYGDRVRSFYYLDELLDTYPESKLFYPAMEKQFQIADAYLRGYKRRFMLIPMFGAQEEAIEMLYRLQQRAPGSPLAERALLRTADYYFADEQFDLSGDAYAAYARSYPRSPLTGKVKLRQAVSRWALFRGTRYDATPLLDARALLMDLKSNHPELAEQEDLAEVIADIDSAFATKLYQTADFYRRTREPRAAVYHYRFLIKNYPHSEEAKQAEEKLTKMPTWALKETDAPAAPAGN